MINTKKLLDKIDSLNDEFVRFWVDFANAESPSDYKKGVDEAGQLFIDFAQKTGFEVEINRQEISGNAVCITMNKDASGNPIVLAGHSDTVHDVGSFGNPATKIEGDIMRGPGVMDCKGGLVAALMAMIALKNLGFDKRQIRLLINPEEEVNSTLSNYATMEFMCDKAKDAIAVINCESIKDNTLVLHRKGILRYEYEITGKAIHASSCAQGGANAILEAAKKICELEKMKDHDGITCNCGVISGGTKANTVPDKCTFVAEIRFKNQEQYEYGEKLMKQIGDTCYVKGTTCTMKCTSFRPAMEKVQRNYDLLDKINAIYEKCGLPTLSARGSLGGSDAAQMTVLGVPCVDSIGVAGDFIHTPDEFAYVSSLSQAAKRIATVCAYIEE